MKNYFVVVLLSVSFLGNAQFPMGGGGRSSGGFEAPTQRSNSDTGFENLNTKLDGKAKILGFVLDSTNNSPVEFAAIALIDLNGDKVIDGTTTDELGKFTINRVPVGKYKIVLSFIGYETKNLRFEIVEKKEEKDFGIIKLSLSSTELAEVVVEGQKPLIEEKVDRTVYNAEGDETNKGGDATNVLQKVPMLSVDLDGNVSLRGSTNVRVLINNKPSSIMAANVADALRQIPAEMIKSVEVITSPSARYDAEGSSGIINIVTKKNTLQGLTLNINASGGFRGSNLGLNGNYRNKNWGLSLGGFGRAEYNVRGDFESNQSTIDPASGIKTVNQQTSKSLNEGLFGRYTLGFDWDINKKNYVLANLSLGARDNNSYQTDLMQFTNNVLRNSRNTESINKSKNVDFNINFTHMFNKPSQELSFLALYTRDNRVNDFYNYILDLNNRDLVKSSIKNLNANYDEEVTFQLDYQTPIRKNQLFEAGAKYISRLSNSDYQSFINPFGKDLSNFQLVNNASLPSNVFDYLQSIGSAYSSYSYSTKNKWTIKAGGRYEYTTIDASFLNNEGQNLSIPSYGIFVPSFNFSKTLPKGTWRLGLNRRIQRPSIRFLNPNVNRANPLNVSTGNPNLDPEYSNNIELGYSRLIKETYISASVFHRNTTGSISNVSTVVGDTIFTRPLNIGLENRYGLNLNVNMNIKNKFRLGGGLDWDYAELSNNDPNPENQASNSGFNTRFRAFGSYEMGKGYGMQLFSFYRLKEINLQGYSGGFGVYNLSFKKDIKEKKGSIGIGMENFLQKGIRIVNETQSAFINNKSISNRYNFNIRVNFTYKLGKMSFEEPRRKKKSITNDDQKQGGDDSGGGQQGGGAPGAVR